MVKVLRRFPKGLLVVYTDILSKTAEYFLKSLGGLNKLVDIQFLL